MKKNIVYLLGAGFSAPLGIPVMGNFLERAKDLYFQNPTKYPEFKDIFGALNELAVAKNYGNLNLYNIEEILSMLEMDSFLHGDNLVERYKSFLAKVVVDYTPPFLGDEREIKDSWRTIPCGKEMKGLYGVFVGCLGNIQLNEVPNQWGEEVWTIRKANNLPSYSVISLNYDMVIENSFEIFKTCYYRKDLSEAFPLEFQTAVKEPNGIFPYVKLHGSAHLPDEIIPPTWNKVSSEKRQQQWQLAFELLSNANELRIIGYSLPPSDNYLRFLLLNAFRYCQHLKKIDVLCLDRSNIIQSNYNRLIEFPNFRYRNSNVQNYLERISRSLTRDKNGIVFSGIESAHNQIFEEE